jgi:hypothetical protein
MSKSSQFGFVQSIGAGNIYRTNYPKTWGSDYTILKRKEGEALYREQQKQDVTKYLKHGTTVYGMVRSVSRSGMQRVISFFYIDNGQLINFDHKIEVLCGYKQAKNQGLIINGCGMDMIFSVVSSLSYELFGSENQLKHASI